MNWRYHQELQLHIKSFHGTMHEASVYIERIRCAYVV